jgi:hypothetical protein
MALDLIVGPANAGKVAELYRRYRDALTSHPPALLVVPNAAAMRRAEHELSRRGALVGGAITTFDAVFGRVVAGTDQQRTLVTAARRRIELARLVAETPLPVIAASSRGARFADTLARLFDHLGSALVDPHTFAAACVDNPAERDLATLYEAWWARLDARNDSDAARQRITACQLLERSLGAWDDTTLFVQGFEDLTLAQETLVRRVADRAHAVITLPYEPGRAAFAVLADTVARLVDDADRVDEMRPISDQRPERLRLLERCLFEPVAAPVAAPADTSIALLDAGGSRAEADLVVAEVCDALRSGVEPHRIGVITMRDPAAYGEVADALTAAGVAIAPHQHSLLVSTPFGHALERLMTFAWDDQATRADLFAYLRSPWSGIARRSVDFTEGRLRGRGVAAADQVYATSRELLGREIDAVETLRDAQPPLRAVELVVRGMLRNGLGVAGRLAPVASLTNIAAARGVLELLTDLELAAPTRTELRGALARTRIAAAGGDPGRVVVCDARASRGINLDVAIILGLERIATREDITLPEQVRDALGGVGRSEPGDVDRHLVYVAATRANRRVIVAQRTATDDGRAILTSPVFDEFCRAAGGVTHTRRRGLADVVFTPETAPTPRERVRAVCRLAVADPRRAARIADHDATSRRLRRAEQAYRRPVNLRDPRVLARLAATDRIQVTALERFGDCSAWWFVERYLSPRDIDAVYDARLAGSVAHTALQRFYKAVPSVFGKERLGPEDQERAATLIREQVDEAMRTQTLPVDNLAARVLGRRVARDLERFVRSEAARPSPLAATRFEVSFGGASAAPGLKDGLRIDDFWVSGKIDRIDTDPGFSAHALVQDYKSGRTAYSASDMLRAGRLQIPLYVLAARDLLGYEPIGGLYRALGPGGQTRGVVAAEYDDVIPAAVPQTDRVGTDELWRIVDEAQRVASTVVTRIRHGDIRHDPRDGSCPSYCPWSGACRIMR